MAWARGGRRRDGRRRTDRTPYDPEKRKQQLIRKAQREGRVYVPKAEALRRATEQAEAHRAARAAERAAVKAAAEEKRKAHPTYGMTDSEAFRWWYANDPEFAIKERIRASLRRKTRGRGVKFGDLMRSALARDGSSRKIEAFLGYTITDLKTHLERQFTKRMSWAKFLAGEIHIDHRRPLASFNLLDDEQLKEAWALTNLQPLWAPDNIKKGAKVLVLI